MNPKTLEPDTIFRFRTWPERWVNHIFCGSWKGNERMIVFSEPVKSWAEESPAGQCFGLLSSKRKVCFSNKAGVLPTDNIEILGRLPPDEFDATEWKDEYKLPQKYLDDPQGKHVVWMENRWCWGHGDQPLGLSDPPLTWRGWQIKRTPEKTWLASKSEEQGVKTRCQCELSDLLDRIAEAEGLRAEADWRIWADGEYKSKCEQLATERTAREAAEAACENALAKRDFEHECWRRAAKQRDAEFQRADAAEKKLIETHAPGGVWDRLHKANKEAEEYAKKCGSLEQAFALATGQDYEPGRDYSQGTPSLYGGYHIQQVGNSYYCEKQGGGDLDWFRARGYAEAMQYINKMAAKNLTSPSSSKKGSHMFKLLKFSPKFIGIVLLVTALNHAGTLYDGAVNWWTAPTALELGDWVRVFSCADCGASEPLTTGVPVDNVICNRCGGEEFTTRKAQELLWNDWKRSGENQVRGHAFPDGSVSLEPGEWKLPERVVSSKEERL